MGVSKTRVENLINIDNNNNKMGWYYKKTKNRSDN